MLRTNLPKDTVRCSDSLREFWSVYLAINGLLPAYEGGIVFTARDPRARSNL